MSVTTLKWQQVNAWRLSQHCLAPRVKRRDLLKAVRRTGGIQAQLMSAAEIAIAARVDGLSPQDVQSALWQDHTLVKTWVLRGTLHLIPIDDLPLYVAARKMHDNRNWAGYFAYYGITPKEQEAFLSAVPQVRINLFGSLSRSIRQGIEAEASRLGLFLGTKLNIEYG